MDIKVTKHTIKTEQPLFCESAEISVENSITSLHESEPERILKCCHKASITSKTLSDKTLTVEGTVMLCVIYLTKDDCLKSALQVVPFSKTFEADKNLSNGEAFAEIISERFNCSVHNHTIMLNGTVCVNATVSELKEQEIICDIDNNSVEQQISLTDVTVPMGKGEKNLIVEEEISIGNGQPSVEELIRYTACATVDEVKVISGKVMVKGTVKIYVLYLPEEGTRPQSFEDSFPFSQLIDVEGITEDCKCSAKAAVLFCDLSPRPDVNDEIRAFSVALKLNVSVKAYCNTEIPVILDAYSTSGCCKIQRNQIAFKKIKETINEKFMVKKTLEFTDGAIGSVIDMWCEIKKAAEKFENELYKISGTINLNILAYDCEGVPVCYERPVDFEYAYSLNEKLDMPSSDFVINVAHSSYTITGANTVSVCVEPQVEATIYCCNKKLVLVGLEEGDQPETKPVDGKIVLYFAEAGEHVWDIARRYNSSVKEVKELNNITEDCISENKKIIIPTK